MRCVAAVLRTCFGGILGIAPATQQHHASTHTVYHQSGRKVSTESMGIAGARKP